MAPLLSSDHCPLIGSLALLLGGGEGLAFLLLGFAQLPQGALGVAFAGARALVSLALARDSACLARRAWRVARLSCTRPWRWPRSARSIRPCLSRLHLFRFADD